MYYKHLLRVKEFNIIFIGGVGNLKFKGKNLILDNFRQVLKEYTLDVQDVVRSAILDDVDISKYIDSSSPYKLDQIRLAIKEGLNPTFFTVSGDMLYTIRRMSKEGVNLQPLEKQLKSNLSEEHTEYVVNWVLNGINFSKVNIALVPKRLLKVYDRGLRAGVDMSKYSKIQKLVSPKYIDSCVTLEIAGKNTDFLCSVLWSNDIVEYLQKFVDISKEHWSKVGKYLNPYDSIERVSVVVSLIINNISELDALQKRDGDDYVYSTECLQIILEGFKENIDIKKLMSTKNSDEMGSLLAELKLKKEIKVSGQFVKKFN